MWIMLRKRLPIAEPPPVLGIFWSTPWPAEGTIKRAIEKRQRWSDRHDDFDACCFGREPDWDNARKIHYRGNEIRVFPYEYSETSKENMREYISTGAFRLVPDDIAQDVLVKKILDGELKPIYDAALLDGCTHGQALNTAAGMDITLPDAEFPPIGWYKPRREVQEIFFDDWEIDGPGDQRRDKRSGYV